MDAKKALQSARRNHCQHAKPKATSWQEFFLQDLLDALVSAGSLGCCACKQTLASGRREELAHAKGALCKHICGCSARSTVLWAGFPDPNRALQTLHAQPKMVWAMAESKMRCQQQCQGTPSMSEPFLSAFDCLADTPAVMAVLHGMHELPRGLDPFLGEFLACL